MGLRSHAIGNTYLFSIILLVLLSGCASSEFNPETAEIVGEEVAELTLPPDVPPPPH